MAVLDHRVTRIARDLSRLEPRTPGEVQRRFDDLVARVAALAGAPDGDRQ